MLGVEVGAQGVARARDLTPLRRAADKTLLRGVAKEPVVPRKDERVVAGRRPDPLLPEGAVAAAGGRGERSAAAAGRGDRSAATPKPQEGQEDTESMQALQQLRRQVQAPIFGSADELAFG